jgi:DNA polymerase-4
MTDYDERQAGLEQAGVDLLLSLFRLDKRVRLLGVSLSALNTDDESESPQLSLEL